MSFTQWAGLVLYGLFLMVAFGLIGSDWNDPGFRQWRQDRRRWAREQRRQKRAARG